MIADEYWQAGLKYWFGSGPSPRVVEVPFPVGVEVVEQHPTDSRMAAMRLVGSTSEGLGRYLPSMEDPDEPGKKTIDLEFARPPYPKMILISKERTGVVAFQIVESKVEGVKEWWVATAFGSVRNGYLLPYPSWAAVEGTTLRYVGRYSLQESFRESYLYLFTKTILSVNPTMSPDLAKEVADTFAASTSDEEFHTKLSTVMMWCAAAFALLNCRNVVQEEHAPARADRRRAERLKLPVFSYHILKVAPLSKIRQREQGQPLESNWHMPLHWTRGHFKTFSAEKPLFGRISGRFWWQPHLTGKNRRRFVDKDYEITADKEEERNEENHHNYRSTIPDQRRE